MKMATGRSRKRFSDEPQLDEFDVIRLRAQQASKYYNSVGLSNGDLPRDVTSPRVENNRWNSTPEKKRPLGMVGSPKSTNSQSLTTVASTPTKYGATWLEPSMSTGKSELSSNRFKTLPNKFTHDMSYERKSVSMPRTRKTSQRDDSTFLSPVIFRGPSSTKASNGVNSREPVTHQKELSYHFSSNSSDHPMIYVEQDKKEVEVDENNTFLQDQNDQTNGDVFKEPPRVSSHLYEKQLNCTSVNRPKIHHSSTSDQPLSLQFDGNSLPSSRKVSDSDYYQKTVDQQNYILVKLNESPSRWLDPLQRRRSRSDAHKDMIDSNRSSIISNTESQVSAFIRDGQLSSSSTLSLNDQKDFGYTPNELSQEHRKNKSCESSPDNKLNKKAKPNSISKSSPKSFRRRDKKQSKSDVPEHRYIIERSLDIYSKKLTTLNAMELAKYRRRHFSHYDWQSMLFSFKDTLEGMENLKRKNTPSGASKAAALTAVSTDSLTSKGSSNGSQEDVASHLDEEEDLENNISNAIVASCLYFRNEIGGEKERQICISASSGLSVQVANHQDNTTTEAQNILTNHTYLSIVENGNSGSHLPPKSPPQGSVLFGIENVDHGAGYYRSHFFEKDHQNYFGIDDKYGPIVVSFRREKLDEKISIYQYRIIVRTCELRTLRGSILEDVIALNKQTHSKGYSAKEVFEYLCPEVSPSCLKLGAPTPKVHEQIMKIDEQNVNIAYKVGVLYCKAGQVTEEDMYNNEFGSPAFEEFLRLLGRKVKLNGFDRFKGGLDVRTDSTGTESVFTTFSGYEMMFHVSTLLPFTPTNRQQLLRKRHIGNDIVTIVFQEPGSQPFNPSNMRSHFQHIFIIVRAHNPCSGSTCYSVAVARSRNIPNFGPPIPENSMFPSSPTFRDFLLTKVINGENIAQLAGKFKSLAMNTREQYLKDLAINYLNPGGMEGSQRLERFSIASRKLKESKKKQKPKPIPGLVARGALAWNVTAFDYSQSQPIACLLGISDCVLLVTELSSKQLVFSIPCQAVLGWGVPAPTHDQLMTNKRELHIYYGRGERMSVETEGFEIRDEIVIRLTRFTKGTETIYRHLRRNRVGELGFRVNYEGIVVELKPDGCAAQDGLKQSSRLMEICKASIAQLTYDDMNDLLRTSTVVTVVVIPPNDDGTPRKCSMELYHLYPVLQVQKINLQAKNYFNELSHERSFSEPLYNPAFINHDSRRTSSDANFSGINYQFLDQGDPFHLKGPADQFKVNVQKPTSLKTEYGNNTKATPLKSAPRQALVGETADFTSPTQEEVNVYRMITAKTNSNRSCDPSKKVVRSKRRLLIERLCSINTYKSQIVANEIATNLPSKHNNASGCYKKISSYLSDQLNSDLSSGFNYKHNNSSHSLSSDSGLNSNNNSSYSSTLSRSSTYQANSDASRNQQTNFNELLESKFAQHNYNNNNNNANLSRDSPTETLSTLPRSNPPIRAVVWNSTKTLPSNFSRSATSAKQQPSTNAETECKDTMKSNQYNSNPQPRPRVDHSSNRSSTRHKPVPTPRTTKKPPTASPRTRSRNPQNKRTVTDVPPTPRLMENLKNSSSSNLSSSWTPSDVQSTLVRMLTSEKKNNTSRVSSRKPPSRLERERISSTKRSLFSSSSQQPLFRTVSDESLCGARTDELTSMKRDSSNFASPSNHLNNRSSSVDSLIQSPSKNVDNFPTHKQAFPLPVSHEWDEILEAAKAAEAFDGTSFKSASMGTINDLNIHNPYLNPNQVIEDDPKRTVSAEFLCDRDNSSSTLQLPSESSNFYEDAIHRSWMKNRTEAEGRLEKIEQKLLMLQEQLKQEQDSKKMLQKEVTSLRRDNTLLLRHVGVKSPEVLNREKQHIRQKSPDKR